MTTSQTSSLWALALSTFPEKNQCISKIPSASSSDTKQTLNNVLSALEVQRDRCTRDKWITISIGGKELIIRDLCAKITAYARKCMDVADVAVQYDPIHAALPWAGVLFLPQLTLSRFEVFGAIVEELEKATRLIARCGMLDALFIRNGKGTTGERLGLEWEMLKLYSVVLDVICKAEKHHDSSGMKRVLNLTTRASSQGSVTQMEAVEQKVLALKGLIDSQRVKDIYDGISEEKALAAAIASRKLGLVQLVVDAGANLDAHGPFGSPLRSAVNLGGENRNALQVACDTGNIDIVRFLLGQHADVRASGKDLGNALQAASVKGHVDIVKLLLPQVIEVDEADSDTETALCLAAANGHEQTVIFLLQQGANVDGNPTLEYDSSDKSEPPGKILPHKRHKRLREKQSIVAVPLHLAAVSGHESIVSILLENGVNAHLKGKYRRNENGSWDERSFSKLHSTSLFAACFWGHLFTAKRLFQHDPWGYISHKTFTSAVETSLTRNKKNIATMLVQEAILAGFKAEHFEGTFRYACANGYTEVLKQILEHFVLENWPTALLLATKEGRGAVVEVLLQNGADMDIRDEHGNLALDLAIKGIKKHRDHHWPSDPPNWIEVFMTLLCAGADTNDLSNKIREVFPVIAKRGRVDILRKLDHWGYNILDDATLYPEILVKASADGDNEKIDYMSTKHVPSTKNIKAAVLAAINRQSDLTDRIPTIKRLLGLKTAISFDENPDVEPLVIASEKKHPGIVAILLQHTRYGRCVVETAFKSAIRRGSVACARLILESQGWEPAERLEICSRSILKHFPYINRDILAYLFDQGISPNKRDPQTGATLLYIAATMYSDKVVQNFVALGADVDLDGGEYGTALHGAAAAGNRKSVELLLSSGADVNAQNERFGTPLVAVMAQQWEDCFVAKYEFKCFLNCHRCCARLLLDWGADVDAKGGEFGTALHAAQNVGNMPGVNMLLQDEEFSNT
ncbi:hypothetical protein N7447_010640 [Penicillium robsamsonii]|uniref:uncharacterized protein n=1 Tax=Penicillium robsamsonii TaxID=1792511 RepID=UPI0025487954|nr:uncharacterized protein N7447_010640 [Penicillium robsamsonii]KAJ5811124.1 hypothetical protein N7447_010640 [Penicillium robsamsonii]